MTGPVVALPWAAIWRVRLVLALWWGRPHTILACLAAWLRDQPDHPHALASQAHWLAQTGDWSAASRALQRLVVLQPNRAAHWFNAGFVHQHLNQWLPAQSAFETALALEPMLDRAWYGLGVVRMRLGDVAGAEQAWRRNTELQPMSPLAWYQLAQLHHGLGQTEEAQAIVNHLNGFEPHVARRLLQEWAEAAP